MKCAVANGHWKCVSWIEVGFTIYTPLLLINNFLFLFVEVYNFMIQWDSAEVYANRSSSVCLLHRVAICYHHKKKLQSNWGAEIAGYHNPFASKYECSELKTRYRLQNEKWWCPPANFPRIIWNNVFMLGLYIDILIFLYHVILIFSVS